MKKQIFNVYSPSGFHWVGDGFRSNNYDIPEAVTRNLLDPFLMLGFAPPKAFEPSEKPRGIGSHPHAGFETVTLVYKGELAHADSAGNRGVLREGGVQWMTAGRGLMHEEFHSSDFSRNGGVLSMSQLWVNLPAALKKVNPAYQDIEPEDIPAVELSDGVTARVISGQFGGAKGPASTHTPMLMLDINLAAGSETVIQIPHDYNASAIVIEGDLSVLETSVAREDIIVFDKGGIEITLTAREDSRIVFLSGLPLEEPVVHYGPFVASSQEDLMSIFRDYESGEMGTLQ